MACLLEHVCVISFFKSVKVYAVFDNLILRCSGSSGHTWKRFFERCATIPLWG